MYSIYFIILINLFVFYCWKLQAIILNRPPMIIDIFNNFFVSFFFLLFSFTMFKVFELFSSSAALYPILNFRFSADLL